ACGWAGKWPPMVALVALVAIGGVRWWIALYNSAHRAMYFLTDIRPVWNYDWPFIRETFWQIGGFGAPAFASAGGYAALGLGLWLTWRNWEKTDRPVRAVLIFVVLGSLFYMVLWFRMLREHDYYFICLLALPALVFLLGLKGALERWSLRRIIVGLTVFWLIGLGYTGLWQNDRLQQAFHPASSLNLPVSAFFPAENPDALGIPPAARLLCPEDPSPNIALLALRRHGWTAYNFGDRITADTLIKYQRHFGLSHLALRNRSNYSVLFKQYFPVTLGRVNGWHLYSTPERLPDGE
ncbi:MAG: hypothetical protein JNK89_03750, partial [Saprospiraceae bacterium]|nr:hypothetical protein [Saprospiraceae bacterium]